MTPGLRSEQRTLGIVDSEPLFRLGLVTALAYRAEVEVAWDCATGPEAVSAMDHQPADVVAVEMFLGGGAPGAGLEIAKVFRRRWPATRLVLITGSDADVATASALPGVDGAIARNWAVDRAVAGITDVVWPRRSSRGTARREQQLVERLTERELEVLGLIGAGLTTREIAKRLDISPATVNNHAQNLIRKLGARNRFHAVALLRQGAARALAR